MSSSQLTFTPSFFRGVGQPPTRTILVGFTQHQWGLTVYSKTTGRLSDQRMIDYTTKILKNWVLINRDNLWVCDGLSESNPFHLYIITIEVKVAIWVYIPFADTPIYCLYMYKYIYYTYSYSYTTIILSISPYIYIYVYR